MVNLWFVLVVASYSLLLMFGRADAFGKKSSATFYPAHDVNLFSYTGRWFVENGRAARADWPCTSVQFRVMTMNDDEDSALLFLLSLRLHLDRVRVQVVVTNDATGLVVSSAIWEGSILLGHVQDYGLQLPAASGAANNYTVSLTKLTQPAPSGNGVGAWLNSVLQFHGVVIESSEVLTLVDSSNNNTTARRRMTVIGASDTAGACIDGTTEAWDALIVPWKYDRCDLTSHTVLAQRFGAELSIQANGGLGLTQNAFGDVPFLLGKATMPDYYGHTLLTDAKSEWDFQQAERPDLIIISLGGNDFNHQKVVPSNETFQTAYHDFINQVAQPYLAGTNSTEPTALTIVNICGQGDPTETARDPNNDRCRPCPFVQQAVETYPNATMSALRMEYIFIPCDGTVVTGVDDIGCDGHKNRLGQERVADYLEPRLRSIMGWNDDA